MMHFDPSTARTALAFIPADISRDDWVRTGMAAQAAGLDFEDFDSWSAQAESYSRADCRSAWRSFKPGRGIGAGTLFATARAYGWDGSCYQSERDRSLQNQRIEQVRRERQVERAAQWERNRVYLSRLWNGAGALTESSPAGIYLDRRGLAVPNTDVLRFAPKLGYWDDGRVVGTFPAMLAAVTSPDDELVAIHRTFLTPSGHKAPVSSPKKLTRTAGPMAGASIKIMKPAPRPDGSLGIGIAEGLETALSAAALFDMPAWSAVSAHVLEGFTPPQEVHSVYAFADNDLNQVGQRAVGILAQRLARAGLIVRVHIPPAVGDWNDVLLQQEGTS